MISYFCLHCGNTYTEEDLKNDNSTWIICTKCGCSDRVSSENKVLVELDSWLNSVETCFESKEKQFRNWIKELTDKNKALNEENYMLRIRFDVAEEGRDRWQKMYEDRMFQSLDENRRENIRLKVQVKDLKEEISSLKGTIKELEEDLELCEGTIAKFVEKE